VQIAVHQRIDGVIPNFYSTYDWNAPPMQAKQKFQLSIRSIVDPVSFLTVAGIAGAQQYRDTFPAYGGGIEGYGKRCGAAFANHLSGVLLGRAVYSSIFIKIHATSTRGRVVSDRARCTRYLPQ